MPKEKIIQCKRYLEDKLGEPISENSIEESSGDMRVFTISNIDTYHRVAQSLNISELIKKRNIYYNINLPDDSKWAVVLPCNTSWKFEQQYGTKYQITRARDRPDDINHR